MIILSSLCTFNAMMILVVELISIFDMTTEVILEGIEEEMKMMC
jgi:hypothetical protein